MVHTLIEAKLMHCRGACLEIPNDLGAPFSRARALQPRLREMLPAYIIEELRRREEVRREESARPRPVVEPPARPAAPCPDEPVERGVEILQIF